MKQIAGDENLKETKKETYRQDSYLFGGLCRNGIPRKETRTEKMEEKGKCRDRISPEIGRGLERVEISTFSVECQRGKKRQRENINYSPPSSSLMPPCSSHIVRCHFVFSRVQQKKKLHLLLENQSASKFT